MTVQTTPIEDDVRETQAWFDSARFDGIKRLYSARQVVEQRGTIQQDYTVAREAAEQFPVARFDRTNLISLRELSEGWGEEDARSCAALLLNCPQPRMPPDAR